MQYFVSRGDSPLCGALVQYMAFFNFRRPNTPRKIILLNILVIGYMNILHPKISTKFIVILCSGIRDVCYQNKPDWLTDWQTKGYTVGQTSQKHYTMCNFVALI